MVRTHAALLLGLIASVACSGGGGDPPRDIGAPTPLGQGLRIRAVSNPDADTKAANNTVVSVSGASIIHVDNYDETGDGKSRGTIYIQDLDSQSLPDKDRAYSGISLFSPTFVPSDLKVAPGDVLDFNGPYQENASIGTAVFPAGQLLVQLARPVGTFRFEARPLAPTVIDVNDLLDYKKGRRWVGMLVQVKDVEMLGEPFASKGRLTNVIAGDANDRNAPVVSNELMPLTAATIPLGRKFKTLTGICTYFFNLKIAPRSPEDLVPAP